MYSWGLRWIIKDFSLHEPNSHDPTLPTSVVRNEVFICTFFMHLRAEPFTSNQRDIESVGHTLLCQNCLSRSGPFSRDNLRRTAHGDWASIRTQWSDVQDSSNTGCQFCKLLISERDHGNPLPDADHTFPSENCVYRYTIKPLSDSGIKIAPSAGLRSYGSISPSDLMVLRIHLDGYKLTEVDGHFFYVSDGSSFLIF